MSARVRLVCRRWCAALAAAFLTTVAAADPSGQLIESHGFHIDTHLVSAAQVARVLPSIDRQLAIVEGVGLPERVLTFMRGVPLIIDPKLTGNPGFYTRGKGAGRVQLQPIEFPANKPILLHELLHAYHLQTLPLPTPEINAAYEEALRDGIYPARLRTGSFLENPREYFAVIGTIFLFGKIQQPPFDCSIPAVRQPKFLEFLAAQFGPHPCSAVSADAGSG